MANLYLGRWEWITGEDPHWRAPGGNNVGTLDLRSIPQMSLAGGSPQGFGLFSYPAPQANPLLTIHLGDDPLARLPNRARTDLAAALGPLTGTTFSAIIRELLLAGDPSGVTKCKPIRGSLKLGMKIDLGGFGRLLDEPFNPEHPAFTKTVEVFRADYRLNKTRLAAETLRRYTGAECRKLYGRIGDDEARAILPPEYINDGWEQPRTSVGDTFDRADSTDPNASNDGKTLDGSAATWSWTEVLETGQTIASNRYVGTESATYSRAEQDLSSDDHTTYIHVDRVADASFVQIGPCARFAAAANTSYMAMFQWTSSQGVILRKTVTGTRSNLGSNQTLTVVDNDKLETEINDSTLRSLVNDVQKDSLTDTSITGNLRAGIYWSGNGGLNCAAFDFWAQDLGGAAFIPYRRARSFVPQMRAANY